MVRQSSSGTLRRVVVGYCLAVAVAFGEVRRVPAWVGTEGQFRSGMSWFRAFRQVASRLGEECMAVLVWGGVLP